VLVVLVYRNYYYYYTWVWTVWGWELGCCRYVHIGPKLGSLLVRPEETDEMDGVSSDSSQYVSLQELWHHLALPPNVTLMLCSNGIQQHRIQTFPSNVLFVQYGFQVCALELYITKTWCWKHHFSNSGLHRYQSLAPSPSSIDVISEDHLMTRLFSVLP
jgi:hypothetical protein